MPSEISCGVNFSGNMLRATINLASSFQSARWRAMSAGNSLADLILLDKGTRHHLGEVFGNPQGPTRRPMRDRQRFGRVFFLQVSSGMPAFSVLPSGQSPTTYFTSIHDRTTLVDGIDAAGAAFDGAVLRC